MIIIMSHVQVVMGDGGVGTGGQGGQGHPKYKRKQFGEIEQKKLFQLSWGKLSG